MSNTLPVSRLINASVSLSPTAAAGRNFGDLLLLGDSNVISGLERIRDYASAPAVAADFGATAPETLAAEIYFEQVPQPTSLSVGRWLRTATAAMLQGAILNAVQSNLYLFTQVTSGGFNVTIDGVLQAITGLNFAGLANLNAVAATITEALSGGAVMTWNGSQFILTSGTTGAGVDASGTIALNANPANNDTVTVNGIVITFVTGTPSGNQVKIGATDIETATNLLTFLNASTSPNILQASYSVLNLVVTATFKTPGVAGNAFTLATSSGAVTLSGATLAGGVNPSSVSYLTAPGSGTDISSLLGMTSALALPLVPGYAAETPLEAVVALDAISTEWYGLSFAASVMLSDSDNLEIAPFIEADDVTRVFGITVQNTDALSSEVTNDLPSLLMAGGFLQTFTQYSSFSPFAVVSMFGRAFSVDYTGANTTIDLMYKQEPGIDPEAITTDQANALQGKRCNVFAQYNNGTALLQYGTMAGPAFCDEIFGLDWFENAVQTTCFNVNYTSTTKVPQTDAGDSQYVNAITGVCDQAVANGLGAPGTWNAAGFGLLSQGQYLKLGYYVYATPIAQQSESDRAARKAPPIQVALKLAGSTQTVDVAITANR